MSKKAKILVVGSFVMDLIVSTEKFPNSGETVLGKRFRTAPGGKGANQAVQAARLKADVTMVGKVGKDGFGQELLTSAQNAGVDVSHARTDDQNASAIGNILLEETEGKPSQNRIIVVSGANMAITPEDIEFLKTDIENYDLVMLQLEIPMSINCLVAKYAHEKGVPVMLNPAPSAPLPDELVSCLTYISPNEHEMADLSGIKIRKDGAKANMKDVEEAARSLMNRGVANVLVTLGNAGAALFNQDGGIYSPSIPGVDVVDPTAAGDSFVAAFCTAICSGASNEQALTFANHTASITVSRTGAQPSLPTLAEVEAFMAGKGLANFIV